MITSSILSESEVMYILYLGYSDQSNLLYSRDITGQRSMHRRNQFELYKRKLGMASSIKSQPDPKDLEDFELTKAEKVHRFGSVGNGKIRPRSE